MTGKKMNVPGFDKLFTTPPPKCAISRCDEPVKRRGDYCHDCIDRANEDDE